MYDWDKDGKSGYMSSQGRVEKAKQIKWLIEDYRGEPMRYLSILDIGCGSGEIASYLGKDNMAFGMDVVDQRKTRENYEFIPGNMETYRDEVAVAFDVMIINHVMVNVKDKLVFWENVKNHLAPGGIVYTASTNRVFPREPLYKTWFLHWLPARWFNWLVKSRSPIYYETYRQQKRNLRAAGLTPEDQTIKVIRRKFKHAPRWFNWIAPTNIFICRHDWLTPNMLDKEPLIS